MAPKVSPPSKPPAFPWKKDKAFFQGAQKCQGLPPPHPNPGLVPQMAFMDVTPLMHLYAPNEKGHYHGEHRRVDGHGPWERKVFPMQVTKTFQVTLGQEGIRRAGRDPASNWHVPLLP